MDNPLTIAGRYNGPPESGNGGYSAGLLAARLPLAAGQAAQVTLRMPPPLDRPLRVAPAEGGVAPAEGGVALYGDGDRLVAEAVPVRLPDEPPVPPVSYPEAVAASAGYPGFADHPFPTCFVCGPARPARDGLAIFPGRLPDGRTAAGWQPPESCPDPVLWAALDCPGGWAIIGPGRPYVLGRMAARIDARPAAGARCVVTGAVAATEGRKAQVRTALWQDGPAGPRLLAAAHSTWIAV